MVNTTLLRKPSQLSLFLAKVLDNINDKSKRSGIFFNRGLSFRILGLYEKAIDDFSSAIIIQGEAKEKYLFYYNRGMCYLMIGNTENALNDLNIAVKINPSFAPSLLVRGGLLIDNNQVDQALLDLTKAIALKPDNELLSNIYNQRGLAYSIKQFYIEAKSDFDRAIDLNAKDAMHLFNRGLTYTMLGLFDLAFMDFDNALKLNIEYAEAYNNRGITFQAIGEYEKAIFDFNQAIRYFKTDKEKVGPYRSKVRSLLKLDHIDEADELFRSILSILPQDEITVELEAAIEFSKGNYDYVLNLISRGEEVFQSPRQFSDLRALVLFKTGKGDEALLAIKDFLELGPPLVVINMLIFDLGKILEEHENSSLLIEALGLIDNHVEAYLEHFNLERKE